MNLEGVEYWDKVEADQDDLSLINLLQDIAFQKYGIKQSILDVVEV